MYTEEFGFLDLEAYRGVAPQHCNTLQHTVTHCSTLQHTATHCSTLQHTATHKAYRGVAFSVESAVACSKSLSRERERVLRKRTRFCSRKYTHLHPQLATAEDFFFFETIDSKDRLQIGKQQQVCSIVLVTNATILLVTNATIDYK